MTPCPSIVCCRESPFETLPADSVTTFYNTRQCVTVQCEDLSDTKQACIEAGVYSASRQEDADALALAQATLNAQALLSCVFSSTQEVCVECPSTNTLFPLIPVMLSATTPSGIASASSEYVSSPLAPGHAFQAFNQYLEGNTPGGYSTGWLALSMPAWLQYRFPSSKVITEYALWTGNTMGQPKNWLFQGSNNGTIWTTLDARTNVSDWNTSANISNLKQFVLSTTGSYLYYRINVTATWDNNAVAIYEMQMYSAGATSQVCRSATSTSLVSKVDADAKAYNTALSLALAGCSGSGISENTSTITMPAAAWNQNYYAAASLYPSIINVAGSGIISHVRVSVFGLAPSVSGCSWQWLLRGPDGTCVVLWSDRQTPSANAWPGSLDLSFDDDALTYITPGPALLVSGIYKCSSNNLSPALTVPPPGPQSGYAFALSAFTGKSQQGPWSLFACSRLLQEVKIIGGWSLNITTM